MRGVVIFSIFDWWYHPHGHSDIQLARSFSSRMPVLFVNSIGMRFPRRGTATSPMRRIARKLRSTAHLLKFADRARNIAVASPVALPIYTGSLGRINSSLIEWQIRVFLEKLKISKPIVIVTVPTYASVGLHLYRESLFYNRSDRHSEFSGVDKNMVKKLEHILFRESDFVLYANQQLFEAEKDKVCGRPVLIGHGVDTALFNPVGPVAPEIENIPRPRVGYFGDLSEWMVNFELLASVARLCPTIHFVLGGPRLDYLVAFEQLQNVHVLPPCPHQEMPARWRALDAAILPYQRTPWQEASEPIKLNEILATGIPAIGTPIPAFTRHSEFIRIAETPARFADALWEVLAIGNDTKSRQARRAVVSLNNWESIADSIDHLSKSIAF